MFSFITSKRFSDKANIGFSCAISYLLLAFLSLLRTKSFFKDIPDNAIINSAITICIGIILSIMFGIIFTTKWFKRVMVKFVHKSPSDDIWRNVLDFEHGSGLKVYVKNEDYYVIGSHKGHEEKENDSWLAISAFSKHDKATNEYYDNEPSFENDENALFTIRFSDIEHIEVFKNS